MEQEKRIRRRFSPEQKYEIIKRVEENETIGEGLKKYNIQYSVYRRWKRQLEVGINSCLRNGRPRKNREIKRLEEENRRLKQALLTQSLELTDIKKEMNLV